MIRDTRAAHDQVLTCLASEQAFLQIPKEEDPVRYVSMLIPNVHKLSMILYVPVATHGHTPSYYYMARALPQHRYDLARLCRFVACTS
jgi:hypothetical protein